MTLNRQEYLARCSFPERNAAIVERARGGETMVAIARDLGLSQSRVAQIIFWYEMRTGDHIQRQKGGRTRTKDGAP